MKVFPIRFFPKGSFIDGSQFMIINSNISYHRQFVKILTCERTCKEVSQNYLNYSYGADSGNDFFTDLEFPMMVMT